MCGIAGLVSRDALAPDGRARAVAMREILVHRGPDEAGLFEDRHAALAHRRLSIVDLTTGQQPLANEDKTVWVSFNANHGSIGPNVQAPDAATGNQTVTFNYSFSLATPAQISFQVWADDTAEVLLDGVSQIAGNGTQGENCAAGAIGCTDLNFGVVSALLAAGNHDIDFAVYQRVVSAQGVGTPFGLLFAGELTPVPEPASILLLGSALTAVGMVSKRRWFSKKD